MSSRPVLRTIAAVLCAVLLGVSVSCAAEEASSGGNIFARISQLEWLASSGAGAWEGTLQIDPAGSFRGEYYDADYDVEYQVAFFGLFGEARQTGATTYRITVLTAGTRETPGTQVLDAGGTRIIYEDTLFPAGSEWLLTLPGTPDWQIPETVRGEIGGTYLEWENYSNYYTLTRAEDGWGFFAGEAQTAPVPGPTDSGWNGGLLPVAEDPGALQIPVSYISATSYIVNNRQWDMFVPERMIDGNETTCWQFSTGATRLGEAYVYVAFAVPAMPEELWIKNGFWRISDGLDQYIRNCRVKRMTIDFHYQNGYGYQDPMTITLQDDTLRRGWQKIPLNAMGEVTDLRICIQEVYTGTKFKSDVAISELMFVLYANSPN